MRVPFRTETDAWRVAVALAVLGGVSLLIGWLVSPPYGAVLFAAGVAAGVTFELAGSEPDRPSGLLEAAHARAAGGRTRHVLVVASATLGGEDLRRELQAGGADAEFDVLAPILISRSHYWASDIDRERRRADERLRASLAWAAEQGLTAKGEVGDPDPLVAIEDELRNFGADEIIIVGPPGDHTSWLASRLSHLARELDIPVRNVAIAGNDPAAPTLPSP